MPTSLSTRSTATIRTDVLLREIELAALDLQAGLLAEAAKELVMDDRSDDSVFMGVEAKALLLLLLLLLLLVVVVVACTAAVAAISPGAGQVLVGLLASVIENGIATASLVIDVYRELSMVAPDPNLINWALLFAGLISWLRREPDGD